MPNAAPSRCPITGCTRLTTQRGRCDEHQRKAWENPSANTRALTGADRARIRRDTLAREPQCRRCPAPATQADHIIPIAEGGSRDDPTNLQGLCGPCHQLKTAEDRARATERRARTRR